MLWASCPQSAGASSERGQQLASNGLDVRFSEKTGSSCMKVYSSDSLGGRTEGEGESPPVLVLSRSLLTGLQGVGEGGDLGMGEGNKQGRVGRAQSLLPPSSSLIQATGSLCVEGWRVTRPSPKRMSSEDRGLKTRVTRDSAAARSWSAIHREQAQSLEGRSQHSPHEGGRAGPH